MTRISQHEARVGLYNEFHARPFADLNPPEQVSHLALLLEDGGAEAARAYLVELCDRYGLAQPAPGANHFQADLGTVRLRWELHTEFVSYTFFRHRAGAQAFDQPAYEGVDDDLMARMPGRLIAGAHVMVETRNTADRTIDQLAEFFVLETLCGSAMAGGAAQVWTDYQIHADGFGRILVRDVEMGSRQGGRLVQRLLEIDTYRVLAMRALPLAREIDPRLTALEGRLADLTGAMANATGLDDERRLLRNLTELSAEIEEIAAATSYRFGASRAYHSLVLERVRQIRESRLPGLQTVAEFMDRRFAPAMRTCEAIATRQENLARRVERAGNLLRTRVDIAVEGQNRDLLASMNRRAKLQLRLQETVEGLSVVAITYYAVGSVAYALSALSELGLALNEPLLTGLSIPIIGLVVWAGVRRLRRRIMSDRADDRD